MADVGVEDIQQALAGTGWTMSPTDEAVWVQIPRDEGSDEDSGRLVAVAPRNGGVLSLWLVPDAAPPEFSLGDPPDPALMRAVLAHQWEYHIARFQLNADGRLQANVDMMVSEKGLTSSALIASLQVLILAVDGLVERLRAVGHQHAESPVTASSSSQAGSRPKGGLAEDAGKDPARESAQASASEVVPPESPAPALQPEGSAGVGGWEALRAALLDDAWLEYSEPLIAVNIDVGRGRTQVAVCGPWDESSLLITSVASQDANDLAQVTEVARRRSVPYEVSVISGWVCLAHPLPYASSDVDAVSREAIAVAVAADEIEEELFGTDTL